MYDNFSHSIISWPSNRISGTEEKPVCGNCAKANRYCEWPSSFQHKPHPLSETKTLPSPDNPTIALQTPSIARLFHQYFAIAKWYDLCDPDAHFEKNVAELALQHSLLFSAVVALSAMHTSRTTAASAGSVASFYHSHCLRYLIDLDEASELVSNGVALATTCLLRSYEILGGKNNEQRTS